MARKQKAAKEASADKAMESNQKILSKPSSPSSKKTVSKYIDSDVRRSGRLQKLISPSGADIVAEQIDLTDNRIEDEEEEEEEPQVPKNNSHHSEEHGGISELVQKTDKKSDEQLVDQLNTIEEISMEEKIDYLYQTAKKLKPKAAKRVSPSGTPSEDFNYKSLYIDSQIKVNELKEENIRLTKKLDHALGKIEAYEKVNNNTGKLKDMLVLSNLGRVTVSAEERSSPDKSPPQPNAAQDTPNPLSQPKDAQTNANAVATRSSKRIKIRC